MRKKWFKLYHGLPADPLLAVAARRAGISRGEALALWIVLMECASQSAARGSTAAFDAEAAAVLLDIAPEKIDIALAVWREKKRIDKDGALALWERQQGVSTARVRAHRDRMKQMEARQRDIKRAAPPKSPAAAVRHADGAQAVALRRARLQQELQDRGIT